MDMGEFISNSIGLGVGLDVVFDLGKVRYPTM